MRFEEGLDLYSRLEDQQEVAWSLRGCGFASMLKGEYARAQPYLEKSLAICQEIQDEWGTAWSIYDQGYLALARGDLAEAQTMIENANLRFQQSGVLFGEFRSLIALGDLLRGQGQWMQAAVRYRKALAFQQKYQYSHFLANILEGLAQLALANGARLSSARLFGMAQKRRDSYEMARYFHQEADYQRGLALLHEQLSDAAITQAWMEGYAMPVAEVIEYAVEVTSSTE
jgi:ATP/maltotriose-dependent transcriptional regulator MalT